MIELAYNSFTGTIPVNWGSLLEIEFIDISNNMLTGTIPIYYNCQKLIGLDFSDNSLSDPFPQ
jgi:Leucine-rich repeat (LRR) protein